MAKADDALADWVFLRDARNLSADRLGSKVGAEEQLLEWMGAGELPWTCTRWKAPSAADIAKWNQMLGVVTVLPSVVYHKDGPRFMADGPDVDWEDSSACEASYLPDGARAFGIKVPRTRLLELLGEPREHVEEPEPTKPVERKLMKPKVWLAETRKNHPQKRNEGPTAYAERLHPLMQKAEEAGEVTKAWEFPTLLRRIQDK